MLSSPTADHREAHRDVPIAEEGPHAHGPCILVFAALLGLTLLGVAQIVSLHQWCEHEAARQFGGADTWTAALQLDSTPAVTCSNGSRSLEIPIAPAVGVVVLAVAGTAAGLVTVVGAVRRVRLAERG